MQDSVSTIQASHALDGDPEKLNDYYAGWAQRYDKDVRDQAYGGPRVVASAAALVAEAYLNKAPQTTSVLDAGCGTGLAGEELRKRGFRDVDGFDLSQEMVDIASRTKAYGKLAGGVDLNEDHDNPFGRQYDVIVCAGVFTLGHVEPAALTRMARYLKSDGLMVISTRNSYLDESDYAAVSERLEREGFVKLVMQLPNAWYIAEEGAHYWIYARGPRA
ncbi:class I SAM-dependent methyltransferase [Aurantimonas sp. A2-1-M11]|uniref:class I SAM-dependent DNA methyltransferase n=1 Tax=Aurantimonas sp. A2-1-M11 TaxID=3113712 RepID=UPI002F9492DC